MTADELRSALDRFSGTTLVYWMNPDGGTVGVEYIDNDIPVEDDYPVVLSQ